MHSFIGKSGFFLYFVLVTISQVTTTVESYIVVSNLRFLLLLLLVFGLILSFRKIDTGYLLLLYLFFIYIISIVIYDNYIIFTKDFFVILIGLPFVSAYVRYYDAAKEVLLISFSHYYFYLLLLLTLLCGGLNFEGFVSYNLSYSLKSTGERDFYSLGLSNIFGLFTIIFLYESLKNNTGNPLYIFSTFLSFFMSFLGGARGDILVLLFLVFIILFTIGGIKKRKIILYFILLISILPIFIYFDFESLTKIFLFFGRMEDFLDGNLSSRDTLILDSLSLLENSSACLLFGCGPGYFQFYYQYPLSYFPHNSVIEFVISYGVIPFIVVVLFLLRGSIRHIKLFGNVSLILIIFTYNFLISLKSGYLLGSYMMFVFAIVLFSLGCYRNANNP